MTSAQLAIPQREREWYWKITDGFGLSKNDAKKTGFENE